MSAKRLYIHYVSANECTQENKECNSLSTRNLSYLSEQVGCLVKNSPSYLWFVTVWLCMSIIGYLATGYWLLATD